MITQLESFFVKENISVTPKDITYCLCIRVSDITPWILERLEFCLSYYSPQPEINVVDFGSEDFFATEIKNICEKYGANYIFENDREEFSLAKARNIAVNNVKTKYFLLSDIDFVFDKNIFANLAKDAKQLKMHIYPKRFLTMSICHLEENETNKFWNSEDKVSFIKELDYFVSKAEYGKDIEFYTSYSNVFFMTKELFNLIGGYCDKFRGHGSEDFDLMLRIGLICSDIPKPEQLNKDFYGPLKDSFWGDKNYSGFRRYIEAVMFSNESLGYKAYHLWHPKPKNNGYWTNNNDWKREKFNEVISAYIEKEEKVLEADYLIKDKNCLCLMNDYKNWRYFLPLKYLGYNLKVLSRNNLEEIVEGYKLISEGKVDFLCMFNPYMKSHKTYKDLFDFAKKNGVEVSVVERGGLPNSIYYANQVSYDDNDFKNTKILDKELSEEDIFLTKNYINSLVTGSHTLESMETYDETISKPSIEILKFKQSIFIPLQLNDDMAVTFFNEGYLKYDEFLDELENTIIKNKNIQFVIKPHPLDKKANRFNYENVTNLNNENIHAVIDCVNAVLLYNSGVGLLALAHNKPVYTVGNAYYSFNGTLTKQIESLEIIIKDLYTNEVFDLNESKTIRLFNWLITEKYSWFTAKDIIKEFDNRKSHAYDYINVEFFNFKGKTWFSGLNPLFSYNNRSYLNAMLRVENRKNSSIKDKNEKKPLKNINVTAEQTSIFMKKVKKLQRDPKAFVVDFIKKRI